MPESLDTPTKAILHLAHEFKELEQRAIMVYEPIVHAIVASRSTDVRQIEQTLDGLLDFAGSDGREEASTVWRQVATADRWLRLTGGYG